MWVHETALSRSEAGECGVGAVGEVRPFPLVRMMRELLAQGANFMENHDPVLTEEKPFQRVNGAVKRGRFSKS